MDRLGSLAFEELITRRNWHQQQIKDFDLKIMQAESNLNDLQRKKDVHSGAFQELEALIAKVTQPSTQSNPDTDPNAESDL